MSCSVCKQRHYAPKGCKCPYRPGDSLPPSLLPTTDAEDNELARFLSEDEDSEHPDEDGSGVGSEYVIPPGQETAADPEAERPPITTERVQQLEQERDKLAQAHATLQAQQVTLQANFEALRRQMAAQPLAPNPDIRSKQAATAPQQTRPVQEGQSQGDISASQVTAPDRPQPTLIQARDPSLQPQGAQGIWEMSQQSAGSQPSQITLRPYWPPTRPTNPTIPMWTDAAIRHQPERPATLTDLRTDTLLIDEANRVVARNTQDNSEHGKHPKSGLRRDNTEQVCRVIPCPHEYVLRHSGRAPTYDTLSLSEFASGYMRILASIPQTPPLVRYMTTCLSKLFDDVTDTDWQATRFAHRAVLQAIENGHTDYNDTFELRQIRAMALIRATHRPQSTSPGTIVAPVKQSQTMEYRYSHYVTKKNVPAIPEERVLSP